MMNLEIRFTLNDQNERQLFGQFCDIIDNYRAELTKPAQLAQATTIEAAAVKIDALEKQAEVIASITPEAVTKKTRAKKLVDADSGVTLDVIVPTPEIPTLEETKEVKARKTKKAEVVSGALATPAVTVTDARIAADAVPTLEETKEAIQAFANARSVPEATEMLALHGATKLKDLAEDKRAPLIAAMKAAQEAK